MSEKETETENRGQKTTSKSEFSPSTMWVLGDQTEVVELGGKHIYQLSHLAGPKLFLLIGSQ